MEIKYELFLNDLLAMILCPIANILVDYDIDNTPTAHALCDCINKLNKRKFEELKR